MTSPAPALVSVNSNCAAPVVTCYHELLEARLGRITLATVHCLSLG